MASFLPFALYAGGLTYGVRYAWENKLVQPIIDQLPVEQFYGAAVVASIVAIAIGIKLFPSLIDEGRVGGISGVLNNQQYSSKSNDVAKVVEEYEKLFGSDSRKGGAEHEKLVSVRKEQYTTLVNHLYDLVTDFYEYGWGHSFHFAQRWKGEDFQESLRRAEYFIALRLGLNSTHTVADVGCGIGGPMRNICRFSNANIVGFNNNDYQIDVGTRYNQSMGLGEKCTFLKCDFMTLPVADNTYDHAYEIEATCHAPDKVSCYAEILRIVKPGGYFAGYEWCVTPSYNATNPRHRSIKEGVEQGNGLPTLATYEEVNESLKKAGWELIEAFDMHRSAQSEHEVPWYASLDGNFTTLSGFRMTRVGRIFTQLFVDTLECLRIAPKGSGRVSALLNATALDLVEGGKLDIFTPDYFFLAKKPEAPKPARRSSRKL